MGLKLCVGFIVKLVSGFMVLLIMVISRLISSGVNGLCGRLLLLLVRVMIIVMRMVVIIILMRNVWLIDSVGCG